MNANAVEMLGAVPCTLCPLSGLLGIAFKMYGSKEKLQENPLTHLVDVSMHYANLDFLSCIVLQ